MRRNSAIVAVIPTYISRIRDDPSVENSDNLRKGAAQIAEALVNRKLITPKQKAA
jgi:aspartate-semialdehyde dehydrogenase